MENGYKKIIDGTATSAARKVSKVFQKISIEKMLFHVQKYEKYLKYKNIIKIPVGSFNKKL